MIEIEEFRKYLLIDKLSLDDELAHQSELFFKVSEAYINAMDMRDNMKEGLATVDALLDGEIRAKSEKITEAQVKSQIQVHVRHQNAFTAYLDAKTTADRLGALKEAFGQRAYMLKDLCALIVSRFYETNSVQGTNASDTIAYQQRRKRLAIAREKR